MFSRYLNFSLDFFIIEKKRLDQKDNFKLKVNFKIYDITTWLTNSYNTHIVQYHKKKINQAMKFGQLIEYNRIIFLQNQAENEAGRLVPDLSLFFKKKRFIFGKTKWSRA